MQGTNTYLIGDTFPFILLDAGDGVDAYIPQLETALREALQNSTSSQIVTSVNASNQAEHNALISDIIISHRHHDHHGGLPSIIALLHQLASDASFFSTSSIPLSGPEARGDATPYVPPRIHKMPSPASQSPSLFAAEAEGATFASTLDVISRLSPTLFEHSQSEGGFGSSSPSNRPVVHDLHDGQIISSVSTTRLSLKVLHTPGHTTDSVSLLFPADNAIFTADTVLGEGTAVFEDLGAYMKSLRLLVDAAEILNPERVVGDKASEGEIALP